MIELRRRRLALNSLLFSLAWALPAAAQDPSEPKPVEGVLQAAVWRAAGWGEAAGGSACWLRDANGTLRLEVARHPDAAELATAPAWGRLLGGLGEGWSALLTADAAYGARWGEPLTPLTPQARLRLLTLLALVEARGGPRPLGLPAGVLTVAADPSASQAVARARTDLPCQEFVLPESRPWRQALEARGRGRGGEGERWRLEVTSIPAAGGDARALILRSSRLPGSLTLGVAEPTPVRYVADDVFVPVWTLGELLEFPAGRPVAAGEETPTTAPERR